MNVDGVDLGPGLSALAKELNSFLLKSGSFKSAGVLSDENEEAKAFYAIPTVIFKDMLNSEESSNPESFAYMYPIPEESDMLDSKKRFKKLSEILQAFFFSYIKGNREIIYIHED